MSARPFTICLSTSSYPPEVGGVGVASQRLAHLLADAGYRVHVVTPVEVPAATGAVQTNREGAVTVHRIYCDWRNPATSFWQRQLVRQLDETHDFDLFHGFFLSALYPCTTAASRGGRQRPVIASIRGSDVTNLLDAPFMRSTILAGLRKATWITSVNQRYLERVAQDVPIAGRASVIRNGIARPSGEAPWRLTAANRGVVGTVGQFRKVKDIPLLVRGYARVAPELRRRLLLAGYFAAADASEEQWSRRLIDEFGLGDQVAVTGRFEHTGVYAHLRALHVYVQASAFEGLPNAVLEAASLGVPLVTTAVGGLVEILEDGVSALLVPHGDPAQLGAAIARVLADDDLAQRLSAGAQAVAARLSVETERAEWLALYARLLDRQTEMARR
jgi:glycosyltransferase involved in cell wall biosynthesis